MSDDKKDVIWKPANSKDDENHYKHLYNLNIRKY